MTEKITSPEYTRKDLLPVLEALGNTALAIHNLTCPSRELEDSVNIWLRNSAIAVSGTANDGYNYSVADGSNPTTRHEIRYMSATQRREQNKGEPHVPLLMLGVVLPWDRNDPQNTAEFGFSWEIRESKAKPKDYPEGIPLRVVGILQSQLDFLYEEVGAKRTEATQAKQRAARHKTTMVLGD